MWIGIKLAVIYFVVHTDLDFHFSGTSKIITTASGVITSSLLKIKTDLDMLKSSNLIVTIHDCVTHKPHIHTFIGYWNFPRYV
jgi:hypothetical protein